MRLLPAEAADAPQAAAEPQTLSADELRRCIQTLERIRDNPNILLSVSREDRMTLMSVAGKVSRPERTDRDRFAKALSREERRQQREADRAAKASTAIREAREAPVFVAPTQLPQLQLPEYAQRADGPELQQPRKCYVCHVEFKRLHFFYDSMCAECGDFNYRKRFQTASMTGQVALVTGSRVKIGQHCALMILRAGGSVISTTRFPHDAALRYAREPDFEAWKDRLHIYGLDLRHSPSVELFARAIESRFERLDLLINNACQTVRRPPGFYTHLIAQETEPLSALPEHVRPLVQGHHDLTARLDALPRLAPGASERTSPGPTGLEVFHGGQTGVGVRASAILSQVPYAYEAEERGLAVFPEGHFDADLQQVDLRTQNSWRMKLGDVSTSELLEVQLVNAVAPFILCRQLKPLMVRTPSNAKHIINVSAMEGIFSRHTKTDRHPHTNMAKAALNMMTRTSAKDYAQDGIFMNAVDTGWVTDEDPAQHASRKRDELDFQPPLDIVDGAARICDPYFFGLNTGVHMSGKFLKDYKEANW